MYGWTVRAHLDKVRFMPKPLTIELLDDWADVTQMGASEIQQLSGPNQALPCLVSAKIIYLLRLPVPLCSLLTAINKRGQRG